MSEPGFYDWLMSQDYMKKAVREGGATVIARCIAVREDPDATPEELNGADLWEATMRERHGDPKPGWLTKEVERQKAKRAQHKAFMKLYELEFGGMTSRSGRPLSSLAALVDTMAEYGVYLLKNTKDGPRKGLFITNPPAGEKSP